MITSVQSGPVRGEQLLLHPADGQHPPLQGDLAVMPTEDLTVGPGWTSDASAVGHRDAAEGPSLGTAPAGTCTCSFFESQVAGQPTRAQ